MKTTKLANTKNKKQKTKNKKKAHYERGYSFTNRRRVEGSKQASYNKIICSAKQKQRNQNKIKIK